MTLRAETRVRARALQLLYALEIAGGAPHAAALGVGGITDSSLFVVEDVEPMVRDILDHCAELDGRAAAAADNWRPERIAIVERNILRIAIHELLRGDVPAKVVIDEALWLTHRFAGARAPSFINGVLDRVARDLGRL